MICAMQYFLYERGIFDLGCVFGLKGETLRGTAAEMVQYWDYH